jgi:hypothetical protein
MIFLQSVFIEVLLGYAVFSCLIGYYQTVYKNRAFYECHMFFPLGAFVWMDACVFGIFWSVLSVVSLYLNNWLFFCFGVSVFWCIRSIGEAQYWMLEQFANPHRNDPKKFYLEKWFRGDAIYVYNQIFWQCVCVVSIVSIIYEVKLY